VETVESLNDVGLDAALITRLQRGDERAIEQCYREQGPMVRAYVARFVSRDEIEDVVQKVFYEVWRSRERLDPERSLVAFTLSVARKRSIDHLRRRRNTVVDVSEIRELVGSNGDDLIERLTRASEVRRGLDTLVEEQRQTLELAFFEDLTQREIAERLGVPIGTVKARMARGLKKMAERIEKGDVR
jgi:RNA polymerase sigma-70 factor (ECF subfamily)